jgi:hypothetical protein
MPEQNNDIITATPPASELVTNAIMRASQDMGLKGTQIARIVGISPATTTRMRAGSYQLAEGSKPYEISTLLLRLYLALKKVVGEDPNALRGWMHTSNADLGGKPCE